jgi:TPR repeat protein
MSMIYLADAYRLGIGTTVDLRQAEDWYRRAANSGSLLGTYELGRFCLEMTRYMEAVKAFSAGAARNYSPSMRMLGIMYMEGNGVEKDVPRARALFESAAALGNVFAKRKLAVLLMHGDFGALATLKGGWLFVSALKDAVVVAWTDPSGDRLR